MASSASYGPQAVSQERVSEVKGIVKTAMAHFPELKSLEVHRSQELFDSLKAAWLNFRGRRILRYLLICISSTTSIPSFNPSALRSGAISLFRVPVRSRINTSNKSNNS